jgi:hypothetical protein
MIPIKFIVDVDMKRTLHDKVDETNFQYTSRNNKIFIVTFIKITSCSLQILDTIKTNKIAIDDTR